MKQLTAEVFNKHQKKAANYIEDYSQELTRMFKVDINQVQLLIHNDEINELWLRDRMAQIGEYLLGAYGEGESEDDVFYYDMYIYETGNKDIRLAFNACLVAISNVYATHYWAELLAS